MKKDQKTNTALLIALVAVIAAAGLFILAADSDDDRSAHESVATQEQKDEEKEPAAPVAEQTSTETVEPEITSYSSPELGIQFSHPTNWTVSSDTDAPSVTLSSNSSDVEITLNGFVLGFGSAPLSQFDTGEITFTRFDSGDSIFYNHARFEDDGSLDSRNQQNLEPAMTFQQLQLEGNGATPEQLAEYDALVQDLLRSITTL